MIIETTGDILATSAAAIVNPVNTKGVMGAGLAAQVKARYPPVFTAYASACAAGEVEVGQVLAVAIESTDSPSARRWIVNLPTKRHWRSPSRLDDVAAGLDALVAWATEHEVASLAVPPLGAGLGRLPWDEVRALMHEKLGTLAVHVEMYRPLEEADGRRIGVTKWRGTTGTRDKGGIHDTAGTPTTIMSREATGTRETTGRRGTTKTRRSRGTAGTTRKRSREDDEPPERSRRRA